MRLSRFILIWFAFAAPGAPAAVVTGSGLLQDQKVTIEAGKLGTVVVFMSAKCPCSNSHVGVLSRAAEEFKDFNFVAVHSNSDEAKELAKSYFAAAKLPFPVIEDSDGQIAGKFRALKTPHAFVITADGKTVFKGGVTNSHEGESAAKNYLRNALLDLRAGHSVKVSEARPLGCAISRGSNAN